MLHGVAKHGTQSFWKGNNNYGWTLSSRKEYISNCFQTFSSDFLLQFLVNVADRRSASFGNPRYSCLLLQGHVWTHKLFRGTGDGGIRPPSLCSSVRWQKQTHPLSTDQKPSAGNCPWSFTLIIVGFLFCNFLALKQLFLFKLCFLPLKFICKYFNKLHLLYSIFW